MQAEKRQGRVVMREVGMAYSKSSKDGTYLFMGEIGRVRDCKDIGLNIVEFIGGMDVPKGLPGRKKIGRDQRFDESG